MNTMQEQIPQESISPAGTLAQQAVQVVVRAGSILLDAGAEVYRVEETMQRIGLSIEGVEECTPFVSVTGIMCTVNTADGMATRIARTYGGSRNLSRLSAINALSRQSEKHHFSVEELNARLDAIIHMPGYGIVVRALFAAVGAAGFAFFFNGTITDMVVTFAIGLLIHVLGLFWQRANLNSFLIMMIQSFAASALANLGQHCLAECSASIVIISSLMLLVPGLAITNAIRDTMMGDYLSGMVRLMEAMVVAASLAVGTGLGIYVGVSLLGW